MGRMKAGERDDVIRLLVLKAGLILEELEPQLASALPEDRHSIATKLAMLARHAEDSAALLRAAEVLCERVRSEL